nr:hypothetical protein [Methanocorpusculum sp.]
TSGDTALRVMRTSVAGHFGFDQSTMRKRILLALPLVAAITLLLLWSSPGHLAGVPFGIGMPLEMSYPVSGALTAAVYFFLVRQGRKLRADTAFSADEE